MTETKKKIIWTSSAVAMTGAFVSTFLVNYDENSMTYKIFNSKAFAFVTGLVVYYTYHLYT